jgi:hypothetical protein
MERDMARLDGALESLDQHREPGRAWISSSVSSSISGVTFDPHVAVLREMT